MTISVVVATFNGEKTIVEQLNSLLAQTRQVDEIIIIDDLSSDGTAETVNDYIRDHNLKNWRLVVNDVNKGWKRNFYELISAATGDLVFPCDQDDVWHPDKIEQMANIMEKNPEIYVLEGQPHRWLIKSNCKRDPRKRIISALDTLEASREKSKNSKNISKQQMDKHFLHVWPGCTLCVRKSFFEEIRDHWIDVIPHDAFLSIYSKICDHYYRYDYDVIEWRRYSGSSTQAVEKSKENRLKEIERDKTILDNLLKYATEKEANIAEKYIEGAIVWNSLRFQMVSQGSTIAGIKLLWYFPYYIQKRRFFSDVFYGLKRRRKG